MSPFFLLALTLLLLQQSLFIEGRQHTQHSQLQSSKLYTPTIAKNSPHATISEQRYPPKKRRQSNDNNLIHNNNNNNNNNENTEDEYWKHGNEQLNRVLDAALYKLRDEGTWQDLASEWFGGVYAGLVSPHTCMHKSFVKREDAVGTLKHVLDTGNLKFGCVEVAPMNFMINSQPEGFEFELGNALGAVISDHYGVNLQISWKYIPYDDYFNNLVNGLKNNEYDAIMAYMEVKDPRSFVLNFTCPYLQSVTGILRSALDYHIDISTGRDLNRPDVTVAVVRGTVNHDYVTQWAPNCTLQFINNTQEGLNMVLNNLVHALVDDTLVLSYFTYTHQCNCHMLNWVFPVGNTGIAMATRPDPFVDTEEQETTDVSDVGIVVFAIILGAVGALVVLSIVTACLLFHRVKRRKKLEFSNPEENYKMYPHGTPKWTIQFNELQMQQEIGRGYHGTVYKGTWRGSLVAIKQLKALDKSEISKFKEEAGVMINMKDPMFCLVLEYIEGGTLRSKLDNESVQFTQSSIVLLLQGIAAGLYHLHTESIIHRDLAARNILVKPENGNFIPKIAGKEFVAMVTNPSDFGLSKMLRKGTKNSIKATVGPVKWMAPEAILASQYSEKSDIWSFGIVCFEVLTRQKPHSQLDMGTALIKIRDEGLHPEIPENTHPVLKDMMLACFQKHTKQRPTAAEVYKMLSDLVTQLGVSSPSQRKSVESTSHGTPVTSLNSTPKHNKNPKQKISKEKSVESSSASSIDYGGLPPSEGTGAVTSPINSASTNERPDLTASNGVDKATLDDYSGLRPEISKKLLKGKSTSDNNKVSLEKKDSDQSFSNETI